MIIELGLEHLPAILAGQFVYPVGMREGTRELLPSIRSGLSWGYNDADTLVGWILCELDPDIPHTIYAHDITVLPKYQRMGIATALWKYALKRLWAKGLDIHLHARPTSHRIVTSNIGQYKLVKDQFIPNHYATEYNDDSLADEHAWEVHLVRCG